MEQDKFVINIGRQLGSGGKAVGEAVARRLGIGVYDKQLINLAAEQSGLCPEVFERPLHGAFRAGRREEVEEPLFLADRLSAHAFCK